MYDAGYFMLFLRPSWCSCYQRFVENLFTHILKCYCTTIGTLVYVPIAIMYSWHV